MNSKLFAQATATQNYVLTNTVKQSGVTTETQVNGHSISTQRKSQTITYFDGLGRPIPNVVTNGSASQKDLVTGIEYDQLGLEVKKYLPYAAQNSTIYGSYKDRWKVDQANFYNGGLPNVDPDNSPFSVSAIEPSSLNRLAAQGAPGTDQLDIFISDKLRNIIIITHCQRKIHLLRIFTAQYD